MLSSHLCCRYAEGEQQDAVECLEDKISDFAPPNVPDRQLRNLFQRTWQNVSLYPGRDYSVDSQELLVEQNQRL